MELVPAGAHQELCQACHRINDQYPAGILTLKGPIVREHRDEIVNLARNLEQAEKQEHPLNRIMAIDREEPDTLVITTTDIHLPRRIGTAVHHAFHGDLKLHFDEDGYSIRVDWIRES
jgi:ribosome recycling factor